MTGVRFFDCARCLKAQNAGKTGVKRAFCRVRLGGKTVSTTCHRLCNGKWPGLPAFGTPARARAPPNTAMRRGLMRDVIDLY